MKLNLGGHPFYEFRFTEIILQEYYFKWTETLIVLNFENCMSYQAGCKTLHKVIYHDQWKVVETKSGIQAFLSAA